MLGLTFKDVTYDFTFMQIGQKLFFSNNTVTLENITKDRRDIKFCSCRIPWATLVIDIPQHN